MRARLVTLALVVSACGGSGVIEVTDAWAGTTPPGVDTAAIYLTITNGTGTDDRIVAFSSERCETAELHATSIDDQSVMRMRPATAEAMTVEAGDELSMVPGAMHVMCIHPDRDFLEGETIPFQLSMESGNLLSGIAAIENR
ncbi:MAG: copper chaperone PCu(A)C [Acidimicrobiia bacterium]